MIFQYSYQFSPQDGNMRLQLLHWTIANFYYYLYKKKCCLVPEERLRRDFLVYM